MTQVTSKIYGEITSRLAASRKKENIAELIGGTLLSAFVLTGLLLLALLLEEALYLGTVPRTMIFFLLLLLGSSLILWLVARPALRLFGILSNESNLSTAHKVGLKYPHVRDRLENILQLFHERDRTQLYSVELIDASFEDVRKEMELLDFNSIVDYSRSRRLSKFLAVAVGVGILVFILLPGSAYRLLNYNQSFAEPVPFMFVVKPGDKEVVKGQTISIIVRINGQPQQHVFLSSKPAGQIEYDQKKLVQRTDGTFRHEFTSLKSTTSYFVSSGSIRSDEFTLSVIDKPIVKMLQLRVTFPSYTKLSAKQLDDNIGDVTALKGTRVAFLVEANKDLAEARLVFDDNSELFLDVNVTRSCSIFSIVDYSRSRRLSKFLAVAVGVGILVFILLPGSAYRLLNYNQSFAEPVPFMFVVKPGDKEVVKGQTISIIVRINGQPQQHVFLSSKPAGQVEYDQKKLVQGTDGTYRHEFTSLKSTTSYFVSSGSIRSDEFTLSVIDKPIVKMLQLRVTFPSYTKLNFIERNIAMSGNEDQVRISIHIPWSSLPDMAIFRSMKLRLTGCEPIFRTVVSYMLMMTTAWTTHFAVR